MEEKEEKKKGGIKSIEELEKKFNTDSNKGISNKDARKRLAKYGKNKIKKKKEVSPIKIFLSQFTSPLIILLILAAIASLLIGFLPGEEPNIIDTVLIIAIVFFSGVVGFFQEYKAEKSIEALQKMATPKATVIRKGEEKEIPVPEIVPGDILLLNSGDVIPADSQIIKSSSLKIDESILTGESESVSKSYGEKVYKNTSIYTGQLKALVTETGMDTKVGKIAGKLQSMEEEKSSFQKEVSRLSKKLIYVILGVIAIVMIVSLLKYDFVKSFLVSISLAVAAVPEGLPAAVTSVLAIGSRIMSKKNSLIRKLNVTESIGAVDVICSDKTGTLTKNEMTVTKLFTPEKEGEGIKDAGKIKQKSIRENEALKHTVLNGALCNNVEKKSVSGENEKKYVGDQTEIALQKFSDKFCSKKDLEKYNRIDEIPFTSERKMMTVILENPENKNKSRKPGEENYLIYSKGAPEKILDRCDRVLKEGKIRKLTEKEREELKKKNEKFASKGLRVLGFAYKTSSNIETKNKEKNGKDLENNLIFTGLQGMRDPPHKEVAGSIKDCKNAGIRVVMITGDNPTTAKAIADEIGLKSEEAIEGNDLEKISDKELKKKLDLGHNIFARVDPFHKLRILKLLRKDSRVAMTGDGVNDALALKKADVGIAMGIRGTEVSKQSSDMILLDDNFSSIRTAIREGRRIFQNIRKFINFLLTTNMAEIAVVFLATVFLSLEEPLLLPAQLLWINFVTDLFPALALGVDPAKKGIMKEPPRKKGEPLINKKMGMLIGVIGGIITIMLFSVFFLTRAIADEETARAAIFTGFVFYELVRIGVIRSQENISFFKNKWLIAAIAFSIILQLIAVFTVLSSVFGISPIYNLWVWGIIIAGGIVSYYLSIGMTKIIDKFK